MTDTGLNTIIIESVNEVMQRLRLDIETLMRVIGELQSENLQLKDQLRRPSTLLVDIPAEGSLAQQLMDAANATGPEGHVMINREFLRYTADQIQMAYGEYQSMKAKHIVALTAAQQLLQELQ